MMNHTYLTATTITIAQHNSDSTPKTEDVFSAMPWSGWNASFKAYSGLVPISPNTMPSTARISAGAECARGLSFIQKKVFNRMDGAPKSSHPAAGRLKSDRWGRPPPLQCAADRRAHWLADRPRRVFPRCWFSIQGDLRTPVHIARQAKRSMAAHRRGGRSDDNRCTGGWNQRRRARPIWYYTGRKRY